MARAQHILVIGSESFTQFSDEVRLRSIGWHEVGKIPNLSDVDSVIFNLLALSDPSAVDWTSLFRSLTPKIAISDILRYQGRFIFVGDPRFRIQWTEENGHVRDDPFLWWTGLHFHWDDRPGESVLVARLDPSTSRFKNYLSLITSYQYSLRRCELNLGELKEVFDFDRFAKRHQTIRPKVRSLAYNRYNADIAFSVELQIVDSSQKYLNGMDLGPEIESLPGELVFIPPTASTWEDTVTMLLRDVFNVQLRASEPEWSKTLLVEGQSPFDREITRLEGEFMLLQKQWETAISERTAIRSPLRLLYDVGIGLEEAVREALRELGATVRVPEAPGFEDGWIAVHVDDDVFEGVLEIKGTRSTQFKEEGLKQVVTWVDRGIKLEQKRFKGIFIGNSDVLTPPEDRKPAFSAGFKTTANLHHIAAMTTQDLFHYLELHRAGGLNSAEFWRCLFSTDGIVTDSLLQRCH